MSGRILVVDDEDIIRESLSFILKKEGYTVEEASDGKAAYEKIIEESFDVVITDLEMPKMGGIDLLENISKASSRTSVLIITAYGSLDTAIEALRHGATDYILKPVEFEEIILKLRRIFTSRKLLIENQALRKEAQRRYDFSKLIGQSPAIQKIYDIIQTVSETDSAVLITGNSGTGKELVARALHYNSRRKDKPFIAVNCGAISESLIESELFGHKKGSFTGAVSDKEGFFKAADDGTLFLDEISEMPMQLQVKLLRVLQQKEFTAVGTSYSTPINVRYLASTNKNLLDEIKAGKFREDLYYRLNVIEIRLPSLKERKEDIPFLVDHFINKYREEMNKGIKGAEPEVIRALVNHEWHGEVRELENIIERAVIFCKNEFISLRDLPEFFKPDTYLELPDVPGSLDDVLKKLEKEYILKILQKNNFDKESACKTLNIGLSTLYRKAKEFGIDF
jgi:DNA-binding NtrC family response regulator